jgi:sugar/nucleoside kinase (ribokinase family)
MDNKNPPALTIIGDVGVDVVLGPIARWPAIGTESLMERSELRAGGSAGNAALAAGFLGAPCRLLSLVGNDSLGTWLTEQFAGLDASLPACDRATSLSIGIIHSCGERTFFTTRGHLEAFAYEHVRSLLTRARRPNSVVLLSGVFLTPRLRQSYGRLIDEVTALGYEIALDTGWPSGDWNDALREELFDWVSRCDHVLLNEIEVANLAGQADLGAALQHVGARLKPGANLIVKNGAKGAIGFQGRHLRQRRCDRVDRRRHHRCRRLVQYRLSARTYEWPRPDRRARSRLQGGRLGHCPVSAPLDQARRTGRPDRLASPTSGADRNRRWRRMKNRGVIVVYILCVWFVISFVTNLIGPLMPVIIHDFGLSLALAGLLPFSFFLAYGIVSIPAGLLVEARGPRTDAACRLRAQSARRDRRSRSLPGISS